MVGPNGEVQNVPIQLSASQLQMLRMQLQNSSQANTSQPIILQTSAGTALVTSPGTGQGGAQIINS